MLKRYNWKCFGKIKPNFHNIMIQVTIRAKNIKASPFVDEKSLARLLEKLSAHTEFKTQNKGKLIFRLSISWLYL